MAKVRRNPSYKEAGAMGTFTGLVRGDGRQRKDDRPGVRELRRGYEGAHQDRGGPEKAKGILEVYIYHKTGRIAAGEDIVFIVMLSGHRQELFPALKDAIERVKAEVPIWKKEFT